MAGSRLIGDRYRIDQTAVIGEGGMGVVYRAFDTRLKTHVALKTLKGTVDRSSLELFDKEKTVLTQLRHPNIVPIFDIGELVEDGHSKPYFVMPLLQGMTLDKLIRDSGQRLTPERVIEIVRQGCRGLQAAHDKGVIHRDIKPSNVFVMDDDTVQLIDFGVVHLTCGETNTAVKGSLPYMSPELLEGKLASVQSDIFAFGVLCYEALTGQRPFAGRSTEELIDAIRSQMPVPVSELNGAVNEQVSRAIHKALAKQPYHRYSTVREFSDILQRAFANEYIFDSAKLQPRLQRARRALKEGDPQFALDILSELESEGNFDHELSILRVQAEGEIRARTIHQFLEVARSRMEEGEYPLALQRVQSVLDLDSQNVDALALKAEIERKRSEGQIEQWCSIARQHLENGNFKRARQAIEEILKIDPTNRVAGAMSAEVKVREEELSRILREKQQLYDSALKAYGNGEISSALHRLEQVIELGKRAPGQPETEAQYLALYKQIRSEREELDRVYAEAKKALEAQNYDRALEICRDVLRRRPRELLFQALELEIGEDQRKNISSRIAEYHRQIDTEADLERKLALLTEAAHEFPDEQSFAQLLKNLRQRLALVNSSIGRARQYESQGQFREAMDQWDFLRKMYPLYPGLDHELQRLRRKQEETERKKAKVHWIEEVEQALARGDCAAADARLLSAQQEFPRDADFLRLKGQIQQAFERSSQALRIFDEAKQFANDGDQANAMEKLRAARELDKKNEAIASALTVILVQRARDLVEQDWSAAKRFIDEALQVKPGDPDCKSVLSFIESVRRHEEIENCLVECNALRSEGKTSEALQKLDQMLRRFPGEARLLQQKVALTLRRELPASLPVQAQKSGTQLENTVEKAAAAGDATLPMPRPQVLTAHVVGMQKSEATTPFNIAVSETATQAANVDPMLATPAPVKSNRPGPALVRVPVSEPAAGHFFQRKWWLAVSAVGLFAIGIGGISVFQVGRKNPQHPPAAPSATRMRDTTRSSNSRTAPTQQTAKLENAVDQAPTAPAGKPVNRERILFQMRTNPAIASVRVDGSSDLECKTPCELRLPAGNHLVSVSAEGFPEVGRIITVPDDNGRIIDATGSLGALRISTPAGATVFVDGQNKGPIPVTLHLLPGKHQMKISGDNLNCEDTVNVEEGSFQVYSCGAGKAAEAAAAPSTPATVVAAPQSQ